MFIDALVLGTSTGLYCATSCAPIIVPFLFSEKLNGPRKNFILVGLFTAGRLLGYVATGFLLGALGSYATGFLDPDTTRKFQLFTYPLAGILMLMAGLLYNDPHFKLCRIYQKLYKPGGNAVLLGLITGFSLCPPFFAAAARVFGQQTSFGGALYFLLFFLGTSVYFLPLFGVFVVQKKIDKVKMIARVSMILIGGYYLIFLGLFRLF